VLKRSPEMSHPLRTNPQHISTAPKQSGEFLYAASMEAGIQLNQFIAIHNRVFGFSLRKIVPVPGFFKPVEFLVEYRSLRMIEADLFNLAEEIPEDSPECSELCIVLADYVSRLLDATIRLRDICEQGYKKSENSSSYSRREYRIDVDAYRRSVRWYQSKGSHLNRLINEG
jgi:hypothetical protein